VNRKCVIILPEICRSCKKWSKWCKVCHNPFSKNAVNNNIEQILDVEGTDNFVNSLNLNSSDTATELESTTY